MRRPVEALLPDLPNEEPWFELKFQLRELDADLGELLMRLRVRKADLGAREKTTQLWSELYELYIQANHDAEDHAPRAVQLAQHLLAVPTAPVPEWGDGTEPRSCDFAIPEEILGCHSLPEVSSRLARQLDEAISTFSQAHQAILHAVDSHGTVRAVLEHVLQHSTRCQQLLQGPAREHVRSAWQWSVPYWRLMDPESAAAHDARAAVAEAELATIEAELDAREPKKP
ncbi:hypothetical protein JRI60_03510 [Archangium violaceum]|uniref:hypothetical protein n=1 Tax=Archangium violaceum TaxID=83451 RepID=UPI00194DD508|nr:hypothetical protein [Archangium violaceum]QRN98153.1 hypothetical protein JRI60_03510 [Archangium violaceum]